MEQYYLSDSIRSSVSFDYRRRAGEVSPAVWIDDIRRFVQSRAASGILSHGLGLRHRSSVARDQDPVASKRLRIGFAGPANDTHRVLPLPGPNL